MNTCTWTNGYLCLHNALTNACISLTVTPFHSPHVQVFQGEGGLDRRTLMIQLDRNSQALRDVCAWLFINSFRTEKVQFDLLCEQSVRNVWRKVAWSELIKRFVEVSTKAYRYCYYHFSFLVQK